MYVCMYVCMYTYIQYVDTIIYYVILLQNLWQTIKVTQHKLHLTSHTSTIFSIIPAILPVINMSLHSSPAPKLPPNKYPLWHENNFPSFHPKTFPITVRRNVSLIFDARSKSSRRERHILHSTSQRFNNIPIILQRYSFPVARDLLITSNNTAPSSVSVAKTSTC